MKQFTHIIFNSEVMGDKPCIRGLRVTVGTVVSLMSAGYSTKAILQAYPYLKADDIRDALACAT